MVIPEKQLETWTNQGAVTSAQKAHESIRAALAAQTSPIKDMNVDIFLQGSYRNFTNIYGDSDVDVVVKFKDAHIYDVSSLPIYSQLAFFQNNVQPLHNWNNFRRRVAVALMRYYGATAIDTKGNKSIKISRGNGRIPADVVPCFEYRRITAFSMVNTYNHIEGICFHTTRENRQVVNFPKAHIENGQAKNSPKRTNGWYKPAVRMFKNIRCCLADSKVLSRDVAPSYFVECLLYNVPDGCYGISWQSTFCAVVNWLNGNLNDRFVCQNGLLELFGTTPEQWKLADARSFINATINLWNGW